MLAPVVGKVCAVCGQPGQFWFGSIYGEDGEENQCNACCDAEIEHSRPGRVPWQGQGQSSGSMAQGRGKRKAEFRGKGNPVPPWRVQTPWHGDEKGGRSLRIYGKDNCQGHDQKAQWTERLTAQWHRAQLHQQQTFCVASSNSSSSSGAAPATELKVAQTEMFAANVALARHRLAEAQQRLVEVEAEADQAEAEAEEADQVEAEEAEEADLEACRLV